MTQRLLLLVGTRKGAFILEGAEDRETFTVRGPFCETMPIQHFAWDPRTGAMLAGAGSPWYGPMIWRSTDLGETWTNTSEGITYGDDGPKIVAVWSVSRGHDDLYAGVEPAGLFRSLDDGVTWSHVNGLREHPSTPTWEPGGGGLILHTIVPHPTDVHRMWVGISAVGVFETRDGGATWMARNKGVGVVGAPETGQETGHCVHKFALHPDRPDVLYQQNHVGAYRSEDGSASWASINDGLPSTFGFPLAVHPHDPKTVYLVPLNGAEQGRYMPEGRAAVWRSRDSGGSWVPLTDGLPQKDAFLGVLRDASAVDRLDPAGVYFGTSTGQVFGSRDEGDHWHLLADFLPPVTSVEPVLLDA
jgi:photosystem II stability/assembly factor-like uncharacterized protein